MTPSAPSDPWQQPETIIVASAFAFYFLLSLAAVITWPRFQAWFGRDRMLLFNPWRMFTSKIEDASPHVLSVSFRDRCADGSLSNWEMLWPGFRDRNFELNPIAPRGWADKALIRLADSYEDSSGNPRSDAEQRIAHTCLLAWLASLPKLAEASQSRQFRITASYGIETGLAERVMYESAFMPLSENGG